MRTMIAAFALFLFACGAGERTESADVGLGPDAPSAQDERAGPDLHEDLVVASDVAPDLPPAPDLGWLPPVDLAALDPAVCAPALSFDPAGFDPDYAPPASGDWIANKVFPLLVLLTEVPEAAAALRGALAPEAAASRVALAEAAGCAGDHACLRALLVEPFLAVDPTRILEALATAGVDLVGAHLRPSGCFHLYAEQPDDGLFASAWAESAAGLVAAFDRHAGELGAAERAALVAEADAALGEDVPFFAPLFALTLAYMHGAGRDEAARYEPMAEGENRAALARLATLDFDEWPFAAMLVPGLGPNDLETPLHEYGFLRCGLAYLRLAAGVVPFAILSGGHVHPDRTPYSEALEMKRHLMDDYGVPEDRLLIDPHARHTTTNLRNAARLLLRYGFPPDKPLLTTTDMFQSIYIHNLGPRCEEELHYLPWRTNEVLTIYDNCVVVSPDSLHVAPSDPLDP